MLIEGPETPTIMGSAAADETGQTTIRLNSRRVRKKTTEALVILFSRQFSLLNSYIVAHLDCLA
jgi:hypothetical protein